VDNGTSNGKRQCPDVAAVADEDSGYLVFYTDPGSGVAGWHQMGGTSAAAPLWAGITALIQQQAHQQGLGDFGFMGRRLYRTWQTEPDAFHDIVRGGNLLQDATPGWDFSTGIGSPDVARLSQALLRDLQANP
jgi:kumamolisin